MTTGDSDEMILKKSLESEKKLNIFLDQVLDNFQLDVKNIALVGFSQGCMIAIQTVLKKKEQINCLVGYSGKIINKQHLSDNIVSRPKIFLMHGDRDTIVSPSHLLESKEFLLQQSLKIRTKLFKNCEHKISVKGRHDPCVGIRAVPIGEAMMACVLLDHYLLNRAHCG